MPPVDRRDLLLDAAEEVLSRGGPQALTLQAVASEAGVSKGGLLYHFSTKSELVAALVERLIKDANESLARWDDGKPGSYTRAYIASAQHGITGENGDAILRRWSVILAASTEPGMQTSISEAFQYWVEEKPDLDQFPFRALIARLASDGLWWNAQFVKAFRDPELNRRIAKAIVDYAEGKESEPGSE